MEKKTSKMFSKKGTWGNMEGRGKYKYLKYNTIFKIKLPEEKLILSMVTGDEHQSKIQLGTAALN